MLFIFLRFQNILTGISSQNLADKAAPGSPDNPHPYAQGNISSFSDASAMNVLSA